MKNMILKTRDALGELTEVEIQGKEVSIMWFESPLKQEDDLKS
jgi:hypothetical protein